MSYQQLKTIKPGSKMSKRISAHLVIRYPRKSRKLTNTDRDILSGSQKPNLPKKYSGDTTLNAMTVEEEKDKLPDTIFTSLSEIKEGYTAIKQYGANLISLLADNLRGKALEFRITPSQIPEWEALNATFKNHKGLINYDMYITLQSYRAGLVKELSKVT